MNKIIAQVVIGLPVEGPFDYFIDEALRPLIKIGQRVRVLFNRRTAIGYIVGFIEKSDFKKLNPILAILDEGSPALDANALKLTKKMSEELGCSYGEAIEGSLPPFLRKPKEVTIEFSSVISPEKEHSAETILLHDLNREKRWPFLIDEIEGVLKKKQSVIILVPEKEMTREVVEKIKDKISGKMSVWDSSVKPKGEQDVWQGMKDGKINVLVGTRSAVFAPMANLGLMIVVDEENSGYKQEQSPHYHAVQVAQWVGQLKSARVVLVSSAPTVETWELAQEKKIKVVTLGAEQWADLQLVDMSNYNPGKTSMLSFPLQNNIQKVLDRKGKVLVLMNRRGFSSSTRCNQCGNALKCERCSTNLTYLFSRKVMACRHCNFSMEMPRFCPQCHGSYLRSTGAGIEKLESELVRFYPQLKVVRFDKDVTVLPVGWDIMISTQAILKFRDRIHVDLAAVVAFDDELNRFDFRCSHRAFALITYLRQMAQEKVMVQTKMMDSDCLLAHQKMDFDLFYKTELNAREELGLPPSRAMIGVYLRSESEEAVWKQAVELCRQLKEELPTGIEMTDPYTDLVAKLRDKYRLTIMLKGKSHSKMILLVQKVLKKIRKRNVIITVDGNP